MFKHMGIEGISLKNMFLSGRTIKRTFKHMVRSSDPQADDDEDSLPMFGGHNTVEPKCLMLHSAIHL